MIIISKIKVIEIFQICDLITNLTVFSHYISVFSHIQNSPCVIDSIKLQNISDFEQHDFVTHRPKKERSIGNQVPNWGS